MSAGAATGRRPGARRTVHRGRDERGGGSMLMIGVCVVVMMLGYTAMVICGYVIAGHRARAAADLAALSGATTAGQGGDPCASARRNARAHLARISACERVTGRQIASVDSARRAGDPAVLIASSERAIAELGWRPEHNDLDEIVTDAWDFLQSLSDRAHSAR